MGQQLKKNQGFAVKPVRSLNFYDDMAKVAQNDDCQTAIPNNFNFTEGIPDSIAKPAFSKNEIYVVPPWRRPNSYDFLKSKQKSSSLEKVKIDVITKAANNLTLSSNST